MITFSEIRVVCEASKMPKGEHVWDKKVGKVKVMIHKDPEFFQLQTHIH